jgi:hypothetical protein
MSAPLCYVLLLEEGRSIAMGRSRIQGILPNTYKTHITVPNWDRQDGVEHES